MSADQHIRSLLESDGLALGPPQVERELDVVLGRVRRNRHRRLARLSLALAGAAAAAAVVVQATGWGPRSDEDTAAPPTNPLVGEYVVDVPATDDAEQDRLAGRWVVRVDASGDMALTPPASVTEGVSDATLRIVGDRLRTNALSDWPGCQAGTGIGTYEWSSTDDGLVFAVEGDDCTGRVLLFVGSSWTRLP